LPSHDLGDCIGEILGQGRFHILLVDVDQRVTEDSGRGPRHGYKSATTNFLEWAESLNDMTRGEANLSAKCTCAKLGGLHSMASGLKGRPVRPSGSKVDLKKPAMMDLIIFRFRPISPFPRDSLPGSSPGSGIVNHAEAHTVLLTLDHVSHELFGIASNGKELESFSDFGFIDLSGPAFSESRYQNSPSLTNNKILKLVMSRKSYSMLCWAEDKFDSHRQVWLNVSP